MPENSVLSETAVAQRQLMKIDRIDDRGDIREHWTCDGHRTLCGIQIGGRQSPCGNRPCKRCQRVVDRLSETAVCAVDDVKAR